MDFLYSLYDALVGVQIPPDKARAVVDAMERDMATTLATKSDLDTRQILLKSHLESANREMSLEFASFRKDFSREIAGVRKDLGADIEGLRKDMMVEFAGVRRELAVEAASLRKDMEILQRNLTIRLGSIVFVGMGLLFAALRLT